MNSTCKAVALALATGFAAPGVVLAEDVTTIFEAKRIVTMEPSWPEGRYVAVRGDMILGVGRTLDDLKAWTDAGPYELDQTFADKIMLPGFVEPHLHLLLGALVFPAKFAPPDDWVLPQGLVTGVQTREAFLDRVAEGNAELQDPDAWLFVFGHTSAYHGEVTRADLDAITGDRPIAIISRSTHVWRLNSAALKITGITQDTVAETGMEEFVDLETGVFKEGGATNTLLPKIAPYVMAPERIQEGLRINKATLHKNGVTTVHEPGTGVFSVGRPEDEFAMVAPIYDTDDTPMRTLLSPRAEMVFARFNDDLQAGLDFMDGLQDLNTDRIAFLPKRAKLYVDGSYVDQVGIYDAPGYVDGHEGQFMTPPEKIAQYSRALWDAGWAIHVHTMGDKGAQIAVDTLQALQDEKPRFNHGYVIDHFSSARPADIRRAANLGANISALIWPLFSVGEQFADVVLGADRVMAGYPLRSVVEAGMPLSIHADTPVSPPQPLMLVWMAVNRTTASGRVMGEAERLTVDQALRAVTIEGARTIGLNGKVGSIRAGKKADFVILERDPYKVDPMTIKDIPVWGTVFEGTK